MANAPTDITRASSILVALIAEHLGREIADRCASLIDSAGIGPGCQAISEWIWSSVAHTHSFGLYQAAGAIAQGDDPQATRSGCEYFRALRWGRVELQESFCF